MTTELDGCHLPVKKGSRWEEGPHGSRERHRIRISLRATLREKFPPLTLSLEERSAPETKSPSEAEEKNDPKGKRQSAGKPAQRAKIGNVEGLNFLLTQPLVLLEARLVISAIQVTSNTSRNDFKQTLVVYRKYALEGPVH